MANDYQGSLSQQYAIFSIAESVSSVLGGNFQSAMVFVSDADVAANFVGTPAIGDRVSLTYSNYASLTKGTLKDWLDEFFLANVISEVFAVVYDSVPASYGGLTIQFNDKKAYAYFKLILSTVAAAQVALAELCHNDPLSQCWIGTADAACLDPASTTSLAYLLKQADVAPHLEYHATAANSAMAQLGISLATLNLTGYAVGNSLDYKAVSSILGASGALGANLSAQDVQDLKDQYIGYWATVGDGTGRVAQYGGRLLDGGLAAAKWFEDFMNYMCSVKATQFMTDPTTNRFRNDQSYQSILAIVQDQAQGFVNLGRISDFKITAPRFSQLPDTGDSIVVPNAWKATYNDTLRSVTVQGVLFITLPD